MALPRLLRRARHLVAELGRKDDTFSFPLDWHLDTIRATSLINICHEQVIEVTGGIQRLQREELNDVQLLEVTSCVEYFRDKIDEVFPETSRYCCSTRNQFCSRSEFLNVAHRDQKIMVLALALNELLEFYRRVQQEILRRTSKKVDVWPDRIYW